ncbi:hypothetical protein CsSME_00041153 [Camellia sinensis var. sinensis]
MTPPPPLSSAATIITFLTIIAATSPPPLRSTSSTLAVTSSTVCVIVAGQPTQTIQCYKNSHTLPISPNISFRSISAGADLLCGLISGGFSFLCWDPQNLLPKRIYYSYSNRLTDLTVGNSHVCAIQANNGEALCWRFPSPEVAWKFRTITSGGGFSCGILKNNSRVVCWGESEIGDEIQREFGNLTMWSIVAGVSHACGLTQTGILICKGSNSSGQLDVPSHLPFEFEGIAMGSNHSCAIQSKNGLVLCWGGGSRRSEFVRDELKYESFEAIEAGLDFICGLTTKNLSVICWGPGWSNGLSLLPLPMAIPGPCVQSSSCSICGVYPNSDSLCAGSGIICKSCNAELPIPAIILPRPLQPPKPPLSPLRVLPPLSPPPGAKKRLFLAFGVVGFIGGFIGICSVVYCLWKSGVCGLFQNKIHCSVQPTIGRANVGTSMAANGGSNVRLASLKCQNSRTLRRQRSGTSTSSKQADRVEKFSLTELGVATNNFSPENKIGRGSFGTVYRGELADGRKVAIKRGEIGARMKKLREKETAFDSELALLSRLHHKHLVELVGFCQETNERLLVYEHMSNGSLHDNLHNTNNIENRCSVLNSWRMRIKIALDAARGIDYLHNYAVPPIIHRDIKSSNILLDVNWTAKVSDFGLSLMGPEPDQESMSSKAVGTVGYIDPEYYVLNILTVKSDVYGLGVVLLELLTGKRAVFKEGLCPMGVVEYAVPLIAAGELDSVLDKRVAPPDVREAEAVELVAYIAKHCVKLQGWERPSITDIVVNLERALALCEGGISSPTCYIDNSQ